jgi:hypothetical protein
MEIPEIRTNIREIGIPEIRGTSWLIENPPLALPIYPPVTTQVGVPIVNIPGCVEANKDSSENENLKNEDQDGNRVYCDAGMPSFSPIDYDTNKLEYETKAPDPPPVAPPKKPDAPEAPAAPSVPKNTAPKVECPTREQQLKNPIGKILEGNKKVVGYEVVGKECLMVTENLTIPDQIISNVPNAGAVTATASIAVVATTSALLAKPLADLLLKVVKPVTKKVLKKIATLRGKKIPKLSSSERQAEQRQRNEAVKKLRSVRPLKK